MKNSPQPLLCPPGSERRDYPLDERSAIIELNDMVWHPPYALDTLHYHNCMEIGLCVEGSGVLILGAQREALAFEAGTVLILPGGVAHSQQNQGEPLTRWRYIALDERRLMAEMPANCRQAAARLLENAQRSGLYARGSELANELERMINAMFEIKCRYADEVQGELEAQLILLLMRASRQAAPDEMNIAIDPLGMKSIEPALLYVSEHYRTEIRMQQLAGACAMSESYFRKVFGRLIGMTPLEYVNRYRIHRAMHLLHVTHASVQSIAADCGFPSAATFARNFARYAHQSPSAWRNSCRLRKEIG